jgi:hypothetical protein
MSEFTGLSGPSAFQKQPSKAAYIGATNLKSDYRGFSTGKPRKLGGALISLTTPMEALVGLQMGLSSSSMTPGGCRWHI